MQSIINYSFLSYQSWVTTIFRSQKPSLHILTKFTHYTLYEILVKLYENLIVKNKFFCIQMRVFKKYFIVQ